MADYKYPYETRRAMPEEFGVFVEKAGANYGPVKTQAIRGGFLTQVVRDPVTTLRLGAGLLVVSDRDSGTLEMRVDPSYAGGGGGGGGMPSQSFHLVSVHSDNRRQIKVGSGAVMGVSVCSPNSSPTQFPIYVKLYDRIGAPDFGSDTPKITVGVEMGVPFSPNLPPDGVQFDDGIYMVIVAGIHDDDDTEVQNGDAVVDVYFQ